MPADSRRGADAEPRCGRIAALAASLAVIVCLVLTVRGVVCGGTLRVGVARLANIESAQQVLVQTYLRHIQLPGELVARPDAWDVAAVGKWLTLVGLGEHAAAFAAEGMAGAQVLELARIEPSARDAFLRLLGVSSLGDVIRCRRGTFPAPRAAPRTSCAQP